MTTTIPASTSEIITEAKAVQAKLEALWSDEGVDQLAIFLDPGTYSVLSEIKELSLSFVKRVASLQS